MMTYTDRALLLVEWTGSGLLDDSRPVLMCVCCGGEDPTHEPHCELDCALSERGYPTQIQRSEARVTIHRADSPTDPAPPMPELET